MSQGDALYQFYKITQHIIQTVQAVETLRLHNCTGAGSRNCLHLMCCFKKGSVSLSGSFVLKEEVEHDLSIRVHIFPAFKGHGFKKNYKQLNFPI